MQNASSRNKHALQSKVQRILKSQDLCNLLILRCWLGGFVYRLQKSNINQSEHSGQFPSDSLQSKIKEGWEKPKYFIKMNRNHQFTGCYAFRMHKSEFIGLKNATWAHLGLKMAKKRTKFLVFQLKVCIQVTHGYLKVSGDPRNSILRVVDATMRFRGCWR